MPADHLARISDAPIGMTEVEEFATASWAGAVVLFQGVVRDHDHGDRVSGLEYSAHPDAQRFLEESCRRATGTAGVRVAAVHRIGALAVGDLALAAAVAAAHRAEAFAVCAALIDDIKQSVPIWKRQRLDGGVTEWVGL